MSRYESIAQAIKSTIKDYKIELTSQKVDQPEALIHLFIAEVFKRSELDMISPQARYQRNRRRKKQQEKAEEVASEAVELTENVG